MLVAVSLKLTRFGKLTQRALPIQTSRRLSVLPFLVTQNPLQEGTMMNKVVTTMYRFARDQNMHVVRFNFRGAGQSTGAYGNVTGEIEDALTVLMDS